MEPISTALVGYAADKMIAIGEAVIRSQVIQRWGRYRARKFFEAFCNELLDLSQSSEEIQIILEELLSDDIRSEVLFDAYRSVCVTRSRSWVFRSTVNSHSGGS